MGKTKVLCLNSVVCFAVGTILFVYHIGTPKYDSIQLLTKQSVIQYPISYFRIDNETNTSTNQHNFFYWEGMNRIAYCWCEE